MREYKVEKDFIIDGFRCVIIGQKLGYRCGYIAIPADYDLYGKHYSDIDKFVDVHGGWTYSEYTHNNYPVESSKKSWWIGFDCAHWNDAQDVELIKSFGDDSYTDLMIKMHKRFPEVGEVRTIEYVENKLINAVEQINKLNLKALKDGSVK